MQLIKRDPNFGYLDTNLWVPKKLLNVEGMKRALEFELPERDTVRLLRLWDEAEHHLIVPRAFFNPGEMPFKCIDCRPRHFTRTRIKSRIRLDYKPGPGGLLQPTGRDTQRRALNALLNSCGGTLQLACGKGKTVVALHLASKLRVPTLVVVDNTTLLHQWQEEIARHLEVPGGVGLIKGQERAWKRDIVLATYQTLANWAATMPEEVRRWFGLIIWDEGHHVSAPTFSRSASLFYGYRLALSATPDRTDGSHVVCRHHVGDVIFKDIIQDHPPRITFDWTGYKPDLENPMVKASICDRNGEVHLMKLAGYFGASRDRLIGVVIPRVQKMLAAGHKVLVLSYSVDEVINLMALWSNNCDPNTMLYTELPYPTPQDVGETLEPVELTPAKVAKLEKLIESIEKNLKGNPNINPAKREAFQARLDEYKDTLARYAVWKKTEKLYRRRQRGYLKDLIEKKSDAGLFTEAVKPGDRARMLKERKVIFAITKYGREGLDDKKLSAIVVSEPMSDRNTLQQVMGRPRDKAHSELVFLEDDFGPLIGQCQKLRRHLRDWPIDEGGPFKYEQVNHPSNNRRQAVTWTSSTQAKVATVHRVGLRVPGSS